MEKDNYDRAMEAAVTVGMWVVKDHPQSDAPPMEPVAHAAWVELPLGRRLGVQAKDGKRLRLVIDGMKHRALNVNSVTITGIE